MHIPDGLLSLNILIFTWIVCLIYGVYVHYKSRISKDESNIAVRGVLTAMVFAFQMLNFPISAGTSGHLLGFVLMAIITSPYAAFIMITTILSIQAFVFADGGLLALGANIFNMGIVALGGYFVYWVIRKSLSKDESNSENTQRNQNVLLFAAFTGGFFGVIFPAFAAGLEIGLSANFPYGVEVTVPLMLLYHVFIGLGEAMITMFVVLFFSKYAPEYIPQITKTPIAVDNITNKYKKPIIIFSITMVFLLLMLWMPALAGPDGLEQVLFDITGNDAYEPTTNIENNNALFPDYEGGSYLGTWGVGIIGSLIALLIGIVIFKVINFKKKQVEAPQKNLLVM